MDQLPTAEPVVIVDQPENLVLLAKRQLGTIRQRSLFFSQSSLFDNDPWEILLEIFVACEERDIFWEEDLINSVTARRSMVRRWLRVFEDCGYVKILQDRPSIGIAITDNAREECVSFLVTLASQSPFAQQY